MTDSQRMLLRDAQGALEDLPVGGVGVEGPSQFELDIAASRGQVYYDDASYHQAQQAWLFIERALTEDQ